MRLEGRLKCGMDIMHAVLEFGPMGTYIDKIDIDGISGFVPISSVDELPVSPTSEQKRQAYLLGNIVYIYVGKGGDTLGGLYQSVELVSLDWGDKSYNASEFSGLGRRWLKKNMVEGVNVLTAAMIGTDNTEYFIQYDYDLDGATVRLPANASLVFMGGSIKNGTLVGSNTRIVAKNGVMIFDNITIQGTWDVAEAYSSWFKMHKRGYKIKSVTEDVITLRRGTDANYYEMEDLTYFNNIGYYVTSTLVDGAIVDSSVKVTITTYSTFKVEGDATEYLAAPSSPADVFEEAGYPQFDVNGYTQYNDTAPLQNLFDIRAKKTVVEEGVYMVNAGTRSDLGNSDNIGLLFDGHNDCELVLEGWLKVIPNNLGQYYTLNIIGCENIRLSGKGGIHGDLLEHTGTSGEAGMLLAVSNTKNLTVESLTFAYAWGDCVYDHNWRHGRQSISPSSNAKQGFHTYKNVSMIYGGRTGYVSERGDNVVIDSCYFYGNGRVRGKSTNSAIDIEPLPQIDSAVRFVMNYEFKNNVFKNSARGLRLERCFNCSVHDNYFDYGWNGVIVQWHKEASYNLTPYPNPELAYVKSYMKIFNNFFKRCTGITLGSSNVDRCENVEVFGNTFVSCSTTLVAAEVSSLVNCKVYNNTSYGSGAWNFYGPVIDCDIYNNNNYGCKMPLLNANTGAGRIVRFGTFTDCKGSSFHDNHFSLDYGKSIYGLNEYGKEEIYHGLPVGFGFALCSGADLNSPEKIRFFNNKTSDDFHILYNDSYDYTGNNHFGGGMCSVRDESSEVFLAGDIFRSKTYRDEGIVTKGGMISCSWLKTEGEGGIVREFDPNMSVVYGEIIKVGSYYRTCKESGTCGETFDSGTAKFLGNDAKGYVPDAASANRIKIIFTKRGVCTSETRPDSFLYAGRKMWETDTNKEIVYDGFDWENKLLTQETEISGTAVTQELVPNTYYRFTDGLTSLVLSLGEGEGLPIYMGEFSSANNTVCSVTLPEGVTASESNPQIKKGVKYIFKIKNNIFKLKE